MSLIRRNKNLFDSLFNDDFFTPATWRQEASLPTDIYTDNENIVVEMELPGINSGDVDVSIDNNVLTVKGKKIHERKDVLRTERFQGSFSRSFTLPSYADPSRISASYEQGVLTITVPKIEKVKPKQIEIKTK